MNELFFALYSLSGIIDYTLAVKHINFIDTGLLLSGVLVLIIVGNLFFYPKKRLPLNYLTEVGLLISVLLLSIVSLIYTPSKHYAIYKLLYFTKAILITFSFPFLVRHFNIKRFIQWYTILVFLLTIIYLYLVQTLPRVNDPIYKTFVSRYLEIGIANGIVFLIAIFSKEKIFKNDFLQFLVAFTALFFLILSSARGPLIFLLLVLFVAIFIKAITLAIKIRKTWLTYLLFAGILSIPVFIYLLSQPKFIELLNQLMSRSIYRFSRLLAFTEGDKSQDISTLGRIYMWKYTINEIFSKLGSILFGFGIGSFGILYKGVDIRAYPHNIFLEAWFEVGIIAMFLFILFFAIPLIKGQRNPYISRAVIFYLLLNVLKSYSFADMRVVYIFMAMFIYPYSHYTNTAIKPTSSKVQSRKNRQLK